MPTTLQRWVQRFFQWAGYDLVRVVRAKDARRAGDQDFLQDCKILEAVRPYTMTSAARVHALIDAVRYLVRAGIAGAIVECGVWKGGSMMAAALALRATGDTGRDLFLYDTFAGMPPPTNVDRSYAGEPAEALLRRAKPGADLWCRAGLDEVRRNLAATGYPAERIHLIPGRVEDNIPDAAPSVIALLRLDTDWYESTKHELRCLYPRLAPGGILIIDDYGHWQGARRAADEFLATLERPLFLSRIDYTGRIAVKPPC
jgi:O-methyltransferase